MLSAETIDWAARRGIGQATLEAFGAASGTMGMNGSGRVEVLCLPYRRQSEVVNVKYRAIREKKFSMKPGGELRLFNLDSVLGSNGNLAYIFEGEMDCLAAFEAGISITQLLSVPNGAPDKPSDDPLGNGRYAYVTKALEEGLGKVRKFVLATDADGPGLALRQDLVNILGPARCAFIEWPAGVKDANDFLLKGGAGELKDLLEGEAIDWPVKGLYRTGALPTPPPLLTWDLGFPEWESKLKFAAGTLCAFTGSPGHGKTLLASQLNFNVAYRHDIRVAVGSFETGPKPYHQRNLRQFINGRHESLQDSNEIAAADRWIEDHFLWFVHPKGQPTFDWFLEMSEVAVIRHGVQIVQLDPFNKIEWERDSRIRETDWIRDRLNDALQFARQFRVMVQILAHPAKSPEGRTRSRTIELEDISGSKHWDNVVDQGLSVFRKPFDDEGRRCTKATLYHLKARFEELGHECKLGLDYDLGTRRYRSVDYENAAGLTA